MTKFTSALMVVLAIVFSVSLSYAGWGDKTEKIKFMSKDLGAYVDVLDGIENGKDVEIYGKLTIPKKAKGKVPCIIWMHGSSGGFSQNACARIDPWLDMFHDMGIATFKLNSFNPRGFESVVGNQRAVTSAEMVVDVYKALELLSNDPRIDATKIGLMGGSKGGIVAFVAMWEPIYEAIGVKAQFAFHISLYGMALDFEDFRFIDVPLLILVGDKDDYTPHEPWKDIANKMVANHYDVELVVYEGAHHSFDSTFQPANYPKAHSYKNCRFFLDKKGTSIETTTGLEELEGMKKCRCGGVTVGYNRQAKKDSKIKVNEFVSKVFGL